MRKLDLAQIEADVVIVVRNPDWGTVAVFPFWECDIQGHDLEQLAARVALSATEQTGGGYGFAEIHDFREPAAE